MNYIYDILLNFNNCPYEVFEWNRTDEITHVKKIPLIKVKSDILYDLVNKKVKFDMTKYYKKTEIFSKNKNYIEYAFLATDQKEVIAFDFTNNKLSKLLIEEADEVIEYSYNIGFTNLNYEIIGDKKIDYFQTRNEKKMKNYINSEIKKTISEKNIEKLDYLYLECFNKKSSNVILDLYDKLNDPFDNNYIKIYHFFKVTTSKR